MRRRYWIYVRYASRIYLILSRLLTSGYPVGNRNASGMTLSVLDFGDSDGGEAFAVYSVKARPVFFGVTGVIVPFGALLGVTGRE